MDEGTHSICMGYICDLIVGGCVCGMERLTTDDIHSSVIYEELKADDQ